MFGELNDRAISVEEVNELKSGKASWLDEFPVECLKKYGMAVLDALVAAECKF